MVERHARSLDRVFAAVSDRTRRSLLLRLSRREATISELARPLAMSLEGVSKHVRVLKRAGLVQTRRAGRAHVVRLNARPMADAAAWLERYRVFWAGALDDLAAYVESPESKPQSHITPPRKDARHDK